MRPWESWWLTLASTLKVRGRSSRSEYWWWQLLLAIFVSLNPGMGFEPDLQFKGSTFDVVVLGAILVPTLSLAIRRMHDVGLWGWCGLVPLLNHVLALLPSSRGVNRWGPPPPPRV